MSEIAELLQEAAELYQLPDGTYPWRVKCWVNPVAPVGSHEHVGRRSHAAEGCPGWEPKELHLEEVMELVDVGVERLDRVTWNASVIWHPGFYRGQTPMMAALRAVVAALKRQAKLTT